MTDTVVLQTKQITGRRTGPHLLITGGVHGDEFEPMAAVRRLITVLEKTNLSGTVTLVPVVNEPAYLRGTRTGDDNLDLARVCPGSPDGSTTEQIAHKLCKLIRSADFYIDLHSGGIIMRVLPLAGYGMHPSTAVLDKQRAMARAFNLPVVWGTGLLPGRSLSVAADAGVPAIYAEYQGGGACDPAGVAAYVDGCLNVMGLLGMIERKQPASAVEHVIEDPRPEAGHMQIQNPSPMTGFFEPHVALGQRIRAGGVIGTVCDVMGAAVQTIRSQQDGIVLVLRSFSRIRQNESVAVVVETTSPAGETP